MKVRKRVKIKSGKLNKQYDENSASRFRFFLHNETSGWKILILVLFVVFLSGIVFFLLPNADQSRNNSITAGASPNILGATPKTYESVVSQFPVPQNTPPPVVSQPAVSSSKIGREIKSFQRIIITEGASNTEGQPANFTPYAGVIAELLKASYYKQESAVKNVKNSKTVVFNVGNGGNVMENIISQAAAQVDSKYNPQTNENYLILQAGSNDLNSGKSPERLQAQVAEYCQARKKRGFIVGIITIFARRDGNKENIIRYNDLVRKNYQSFADFIIDAAENPALSNAESPIYFQADGIHLQNKGYAELGNMVVDQLNARLKK